MTEVSVEVIAAQEGVRDVLAALVREYDSHSGAFEGLDYVSPWAFVTPAWARRAACTTTDLQRMITELRVHTATGRPVPADVLDIEERFRRAAKEWIIDTGYVRPPVSNRFVLERFPNRDAIKRHVARRWKTIPFSDSHARGDPGNIDLFGIFFDRFGHRVSTSVALKLRYSGLIRGYISFPYYKEGEPRLWDIESLTGNFLFRNFGLPGLPEMELFVSRTKDDYRELDLFLDIVERIVRRLLPTVH